MIAEMCLNRIDPHVVQATELGELMKRDKQVRQIKCRTGNFEGPGDFPLFKPIEISGVNEMPGNFSPEMPVSWQYLDGVQFGKIGGELGVQLLSSGDFPDHLNFAS